MDPSFLCRTAAWRRRSLVADRSALAVIGKILDRVIAHHLEFLIDAEFAQEQCTLVLGEFADDPYVLFDGDDQMRATVPVLLISSILQCS